jgi:hypothetical protein
MHSGKTPKHSGKASPNATLREGLPGKRFTGKRPSLSAKSRALGKAFPECRAPSVGKPLFFPVNNHKSTTINISQSTFMNHKGTNMFGIHNILQTIQKYTLLSSQVNVNCPEFQKKFKFTATYI